MGRLLIGSAIEKGILKVGSLVSMPVDMMRDTRVPKSLSGAENDYIVGLDLTDRNVNSCLCSMISEPESENGCICLVGEVMPIEGLVQGAIGFANFDLCLHYIASNQFGFPKLGIVARCLIVEKKQELERIKELLPKPKRPWPEEINNISRFYMHESGEDCLILLDEYDGYGIAIENWLYSEDLYNGKVYKGSESFNIRPKFEIPVCSRRLEILVDESHDGKSEETAFIIQGPGMPKIA